ncbi:MAG: hypothetical protein IKU25_03665 [Clostridia bacterium]|nr:hypothetical protein [Clostridia bacterium]
MNNANMRFKDFVWPINPAEISFSTKNTVKELNLLYGGCILQNLGRQPKIISGKGTFTGENAFFWFSELEKLFAQNTSGILLISGIAPCNATFTKLKMLGQPAKDTVQYEFVFVEDIGEIESNSTQSCYVVLSCGQNLWHISNLHCVAIETLMKLNPFIPSPWEVKQGDVVRIK